MLIKQKRQSSQTSRNNSQSKILSKQISQKQIPCSQNATKDSLNSFEQISKKAQQLESNIEIAERDHLDFYPVLYEFQQVHSDQVEKNSKNKDKQFNKIVSKIYSEDEKYKQILLKSDQELSKLENWVHAGYSGERPNFLAFNQRWASQTSYNSNRSHYSRQNYQSSQTAKIVQYQIQNSNSSQSQMVPEVQNLPYNELFNQCQISLTEQIGHCQLLIESIEKDVAEEMLPNYSNQLFECINSKERKMNEEFEQKIRFLEKEFQKQTDQDISKLENIFTKSKQYENIFQEELEYLQEIKLDECKRMNEINDMINDIQESVDEIEQSIRVINIRRNYI